MAMRRREELRVELNQIESFIRTAEALVNEAHVEADGDVLRAGSPRSVNFLRPGSPRGRPRQAMVQQPRVLAERQAKSPTVAWEFSADPGEDSFEFS